MLIEISKIRKSFDKVVACDDLSLNIEEGEILGLVGESGSGKSTLARLILKLIAPDSGEIIYHGIQHIRRQCQIVFQDPQTSLNPRIRIGEAISEPIEVHKLIPRDNIPDRINYLLDLVKLSPEYARRYPHELSGGERQRIGIARALSVSPKFLVLDEPVSALDVTIQVEILKLLKEIKQKLGLTCVFIAHDLNVVGYMSDRIAVMQQGKIIEVGRSDKILKQPSTDYAKKLIDSTLPI